MANRNELEGLANRAETNMAQYFDYTDVNGDGSTFQAPIFSNYVEARILVDVHRQCFRSNRGMDGR